MSWLENEDKVEPKRSARGMEAAFCQIQHNLEILKQRHSEPQSSRGGREPAFLYHLLLGRFFKF